MDSEEAGESRLRCALHFMYDNFCRVHKTLRVTPAMEAGLTDHVRTLEELCELLPEPVATDRQSNTTFWLASNNPALDWGRSGLAPLGKTKLH
jgi:hypothetical protein